MRSRARSHYSGHAEDVLNWTERALVFDCGEDQLVGVLTVPDRPAGHGVLIVVGGPQYRVGSHRQFTLLARHLAETGVASLRFDYRGMGDSSGGPRSFENIEEDICSAIDRLLALVPAVQDVVIWGLCGAASAAMLYAPRDRRVRGLVLLNPWVRTDSGIARVRIRHYYSARLLEGGFWRKVIRGELNALRAGQEFGQAVIRAVRGNQSAAKAATKSLPERMEHGLRHFTGSVLVVLSGKDYTAQEFKDLISRSAAWQELMRDARVSRQELHEANHTFASRAWRDQVARWTTDWVRQLPEPLDGCAQAAIRSANSSGPKA